MAIVGDILQFIASGSYLGQPVVNVFFFEVFAASDPPVNLFALADDWFTDFGTRVLMELSDELSYTNLIVNNLTDGLQFAEYSATITGGQDVVPLPSFVSLGVKLTRSTKITRNGYKRFPGLGEAQVLDNEIIPATIDIADIEAFCGLPTLYPDYNGMAESVTLRPVIVGRTLNVNGIYELDLAKVNPVANAAVNVVVTTQRSRKA